MRAGAFGNEVDVVQVHALYISWDYSMPQVRGGHEADKDNEESQTTYHCTCFLFHTAYISGGALVRQHPF